ncbi:ABC transporter permease [Streptomyces sp. BR123]|uniref:ABC transporter permease n=1 Tax=Streptomyces sp. BR123 TaxID=2749828 RepID=UPI0015C47FB7|nr:ABC transporter permease [Streptomyces sp. BR123]NXY95709.1 ABC transporter permease [Streptomyces sp. BR123]
MTRDVTDRRPDPADDPQPGAAPRPDSTRSGKAAPTATGTHPDNSTTQAVDGTRTEHGARNGGAAERRVRPAAWVRTRLRAAPLGALLAAALAFTAVLLAAALPRALDRGADQALRSFLHGRPAPTSLIATSDARVGPQTPEGLDQVLAELLARTGPVFRIAPTGPVHGTRALGSRALTNPELSRPEGVSPQLNLLYLRQAAAHARLVAGRWPAGGAPEGPVPVALSQKAAETLNVRLGTVLETPPDLFGRPYRAEVVGLYAAHDEDDPYWADLPCLTRACANLTRSRLPEMFWQTAALVGPDGIDRLGPWGEGSEDFWRLPVDTAVLRADRLDAVKQEVASYTIGRTASELERSAGRANLRITSRLPQLFAQAEARRQAAAPLAAIGPAGVTGVAVVVFCLAGALAADRRQAELRLLTARGGSRAGIVGRLLGEGAVTVLPAAVAATALAVVLLPTPRWAGTLLAAAATTLFVLLAFPVRAAVLLSPPRAPAPRRRLVAELLVLAATAAAVYEVRRRGIAPAGQGPDLLLIAAPLLLALSGGLMLARLQPAVVGGLARAAGRGRGLVGFLGLARAARGTGGRGRPSALPLVALLLAVTTGGFGATVLEAVDSARIRAARLAVGGDVQIAAPPGHAVPGEMSRAAAALPGVRTAVEVWTYDNAFLFGTAQGSTQVTVVIADPVRYAELARAVGRGRFDPAVLATGGSNGTGADAGSAAAPVPALFSSALARLAPPGGEPLRLHLDSGGELRIRGAGVVDGTPAKPDGGGAVIVLPAGPATAAALPRGPGPDRWFATGPVDGDRLEELVRATAPAGKAARFRLETSTAVAAGLGENPLQRSAGRLFWGSLAGALGFALLAVLLTLVRAAPERAAVLARLRTMGLRPRQGLRLILVEALPQAVGATIGGAVVGLSAVALLGPYVDLSTMVGAPVPPGLRPAVLPVLAQALGLTALVALAVIAETAVSGRRQITTELRAGDQR